jgi:predicted dehydrogenase
MKANSFYISRRRFLKTSTLMGTTLGLPAWFIERDLAEAAPATKLLGPNDRPGIALVGCGGQGRGDCNGARRFGDVLVVCDVDESHAADAAKQFTKDGKAPDQYTDFRKVMERDDIHVIINGTPDHWHTFVNLLAVRRGKDIYSEKPLTLTIDEGKRLVRAVKQHKTVFQVGSQQRSDKNFRLACELVRNGRIGKLQHIIVGLPTGPREGPFKPIPIPTGFHWDFYVGQTPKVDYVGETITKAGPDGKTETTDRVRNAHGDFRWWWQFSGGQMTDWGAHHNDIAQWGNGSERSGPVEVQGKSLQEMIPGGFDAASKYRVEFKYANGVTMTVADGSTPTERDVYSDKKGTRNGVQFLGPDGWIFVTRGKIEASKPELLNEPLPDQAQRLYKSDHHMGNFFDCVRSRKDPICPAEIGHRSISVAHLGVISVRMGGVALKWDPAKEEFTGEHAKEAKRWLTREMRKPYDYSFIS